jgi:hypothetical protein
MGMLILADNVNFVNGIDQESKKGQLHINSTAKPPAKPGRMAKAML